MEKYQQKSQSGGYPRALDYGECRFCPRNCGVDRASKRGYCGAPDKAVVSKTMLHRWEEPVISGGNGSGAVFFSGCNLRCVYCQNKEISYSVKGREYSSSELADEFLRLQEEGADNINLVTATPYLLTVLEALDASRKLLRIPVIYNSSGYETVEAVEALGAFVDVFLPDLKYFDSELSSKYSSAPDYNEAAVKAIRKMLELRPQPEIENGLIKRGVIIRHLVLPGCWKDSVEVMRQIASLKEGKPLVSIMSQFTPDFTDTAELKRRITSYEYKKVVEEALRLNLDGFIQERESASVSYTPEFSKNN